MFISILKANLVTMNSPISENGSGGGGNNKPMGVYLRICGNTISTNMSFALNTFKPIHLHVYKSAMIKRIKHLELY